MCSSQWKRQTADIYKGNRKYKKAIKYEFYFEAMIITYAMLEDRINSFLFYLDVVNRDNDGKIVWNFKNKFWVKEIYISNFDYNKFRISLNKIIPKINLLISILKWYKYAYGNNLTLFQQQLCKKCQKLDIDKLLNSLNELLDWCNYRNQIVHDLMNKKVMDIDSTVGRNSEDAYSLVRFIDSQVKKIKNIK